MPSTSKRSFWNIFIRTLIVGALGYAIYRQVFAREDAAALWDTFRARFTGVYLGWLFLAVLLVPVNWLLETIKWRRLVRGFVRFSLLKTYAAILAGLALGLFTPSRIGEYGGRAILVEAEHNWRSVVATFVGNLAQLIVLLVGGVLGSLWFFRTVYPLEPGAFWGLFVAAVGVILFLLLLYFRMEHALPLLKQRLPDRWTRWLTQLDQLRHYTPSELGVAFALSALRYGVFTGQYFLLLKFYGIPVDYPTAMAGVATIFLLHSGLPFPPVVELLARGEIALFVWGNFSDADLNILATTYTLFILNLAVPALLGAAVIVRTDVLKSFGYEK